MNVCYGSWRKLRLIRTRIQNKEDGREKVLLDFRWVGLCKGREQIRLWSTVEIKKKKNFFEQFSTWRVFNKW